MKSLDAFLHPKRKPNLKIALSTAFQDEEGKPLEWELRQLAAKEGLEMKEQLEGVPDYMQIMTEYVAESLVFPDLHDKELLDALSEREKRPVLKASDALVALVSDAELAELVQQYTKHNDLVQNFGDAVNDAKN